jgi:cell division protein ZapA (FtsZ GTPase activity inhibitor)
MSAPERVDFELLGQRHTIRTEASPEYVRQLVAYLEAKVEQVRGSGGQDPAKVLVVAALAIADELFREREDHTRTEGDATSRLGVLLTLLEAVAPPGESPPRAHSP